MAVREKAEKRLKQNLGKMSSGQKRKLGDRTQLLGSHDPQVIKEKDTMKGLVGLKRGRRGTY
jgi:mRNA-degrading endonuclease RelE of RelBE toxin-antitoxin system